MLLGSKLLNWTQNRSQYTYINIGILYDVKLDTANRFEKFTVRRIRPAAEKLHEMSILQHRLGLTPREAEVLHWVIQGKRNIEIAEIIRAHAHRRQTR